METDRSPASLLRPAPRHFVATSLRRRQSRVATLASLSHYVATPASPASLSRYSRQPCVTLSLLPPVLPASPASLRGYVATPASPASLLRPVCLTTQLLPPVLRHYVATHASPASPRCYVVHVATSASRPSRASPLRRWLFSPRGCVLPPEALGTLSAVPNCI